MIYTKPDYYDEFTCIADKCKDTCCSGWQIVIDDEYLNKQSIILENIQSVLTKDQKKKIK